LFFATFLLYLPSVYVYFYPREEINNEPIDRRAEVALLVSFLCLFSGIFNAKSYVTTSSAINASEESNRNLHADLQRNPNEEVSPKITGALLYLASAKPDFVADTPLLQYSLQHLTSPQIQSGVPHAIELLNGNNSSLGRDIFLKSIISKFNPHVQGVFLQALNFSQVFGRFQASEIDVTLLDTEKARERFIRTFGLFDACVMQVQGKSNVSEDGLNALQQFKKSLIKPMEEMQKAQFVEITFTDGQTASFSREFLSQHSIQFKEQFMSGKPMTLNLDVNMEAFKNLLYVCENGKSCLGYLGLYSIACSAKNFKFDKVTDLCLEMVLDALCKYQHPTIPVRRLEEPLFNRTQISPEVIADKLNSLVISGFPSERVSRVELAQTFARNLEIPGLEEALLEKLVGSIDDDNVRPELLKMKFRALAFAGKKKEAMQASIKYYQSLQITPGHSIWDSWQCGGVQGWEREYFTAYYKSEEGAEILERETFGLIPNDLKLLLQ
jgi:hypothetical protein